jgi:uncharacterized protein (TIGR03067 family)
MRLALLAVTFVASTTLAAPAPFAKPDSRPDRRTDWARLQGEWEMVKVSNRLGNLRPPPRDFSETLAISGNRFEQHWRDRRGPGSNSYSEGTFSLEPDATPRRITFHSRKGGVIKGIYRFQGDALVVRLGPSKKRPYDFDTSQEDSLTVVYRRKQRG